MPFKDYGGYRKAHDYELELQPLPEAKQQKIAEAAIKVMKMILDIGLTHNGKGGKYLTAMELGYIATEVWSYCYTVLNNMGWDIPSHFKRDLDKMSAMKFK